MIRRRNMPHLLALMLPLMLLRALLPAGYMPVVEQGALRIVLCSAGLALYTSAHNSDHGSDEHAPRAISADCAFAYASPAAPPVHYAAAVTTLPIQWPAAFGATLQLPPSTGPPRTAGARAPPALSETA